MKNIFIVIVLAVVVGLGVYVIGNKQVLAPQEQPQIETTSPQQQNTYATGTGGETPNQQTQPSTTTYCNLTVNSPVAGNPVSFPLTIVAIRGVVQTGQCNWGIFEAVGGTVKVENTQGTVLASVQLHATTDWMTTNPVTLSGTISSLSQHIASGTPLSFVFTSDTASGSTPTTFSLQAIQQ